MVHAKLSLLIFLGISPLILPATAAAEPRNELEAAIDPLAEDLLFGIAETHTGTLTAAIYPFVETFAADAKTGSKLTSSETLLARAIQGQLAAALGERRRIRILERQSDAPLKEQDVNQSGKFDKETIAKYGRFIGAQGVITGEILNLVRRVQITTRVIDVETLETLATAAITVDADAIDCELLKNCGNDHGKNTESEGDFDRVPRSQQTLTIDGLNFSLLKCGPQGNSIKCSFLAEHRTQGKMNLSLALYNCTATLESGTVAEATRLTLGTDKVNSGHGLNFAVYSLAPVTPTAVEIEFGELPGLPSKIRNLQVKFRQKDREFHFYDVPVRK